MNYIKSEANHKAQAEISAEAIENQIRERELSYFERKVFKKCKNLLVLLEEDRLKSKDKEEEKKKEKWK